MEPQQETPPPIIDQLKEYAELRIKLARYKAIEGGSSVAGSLIADGVAIGSMVLAFIFASCTLAYYLGDLLGATWKGFGCVAIIYLVIAVVIKLNKKNFEKSISNKLIQKIFKN
jgi:hypothetical protein